MLTPAEIRGQELKRLVRSAAALYGLFDDAAIGRATGRTRITVGQWWKGSKPEPETIARLSEVTGLSADELVRFVYLDGKRPTIVAPGSAPEAAVGEGIRRDQERQRPGEQSEHAPSTERPPRGSGAGRG